MKRGDLVTVSLPGAYGKPRPAMVIQSDMFAEHSSVTLLPFSSHVIDAEIIRVTVQPSEQNGLTKICQVAVDKAQTIPREKVGPTFGKINAKTLEVIERNLSLFMGIAK